MTKLKKYNPAQPSQRKTPRPGETIRDGLTNKEVVVKAEEQDELQRLRDSIAAEYGKAKKAWITMSMFFSEINEKRLYLPAGYEYFKTFLEGEYPEIGRRTVMLWCKINRAFKLRVHHGALALPEICGLDYHKLESLARLSEDKRDLLREKGYFTYGDNPSRMINVQQLGEMTREDVQALVSKIIASERGLSAGATAKSEKPELDEAQVFDRLVKIIENGFWGECTMPALEEMSAIAPKLDKRTRRSYATSLEDIGRMLLKYAGAIRAGKEFKVLPREGKQ